MTQLSNFDVASESDSIIFYSSVDIGFITNKDIFDNLKALTKMKLFTRINYMVKQ